MEIIREAHTTYTYHLTVSEKEAAALKAAVRTNSSNNEEVLAVLKVLLAEMDPAIVSWGNLK